MKVILIFLAVAALIFIVLKILTMSSQNNIEQYPYTVVKQFKNIEIRNYESSLFTSVKIASSKYREASNQGFSILAGYIFGGNEKNEKIAMTSPVSMSLEDSMTMMFMVPKNYKKDALPRPKESSITFKEEPAKTVAAISFGGWANDENIGLYKEKLIRALLNEGISFTDRFFLLGYNAPSEMLNRRNEIIVELDQTLPSFSKS